MEIKKITSQHRRDFSATMKCEHCGHEQELTSGYDDHYYHANVIPNMKCGKCGKKGSEKSKIRTPKHSASTII